MFWVTSHTPLKGTWSHWMKSSRLAINRPTAAMAVTAVMVKGRDWMKIFFGGSGGSAGDTRLPGWFSAGSFGADIEILWLRCIRGFPQVPRQVLSLLL